MSALEDEGLRTYTVSFDIVEEQFEVVGEALPNEAEGVKRRSLERVADRLATEVRHDDYDFQMLDRPVAVAAKGYGGMSWNKDWDPNSKCTSAFTVRKQGSWTEGVSSAAHCEYLDEIHDRYENDWYPTYFQNEYMGWAGDFEWRTTTTDDLPKFYNGVSLTTATWRISNSSLNQGAHWVKHFGRASGGCNGGWVTDPSHDQVAWVPWTQSTITITDAVLVEGCGVQNRDSGGPVFAGSTAYGVVQGFSVRYVPGSGTQFDLVFSKAQNMESNIGVYIQFG